MDSTAALTGTTANGVPFVAVPAASVTADTPVVVAWHLLDPPRTPEAFAAALPLAGLDATRIYLGLPLTGARTPPGGPDEIMRLAMDDGVLKLHGPLHDQAVAEFPAAFAELRERLGIGTGAPVGLLGGSAGSSVAADVLAGGSTHAVAAVLVSPMLQLRALVDFFDSFSGDDDPYHWTPEADAVAARLDFVERAPEIVAGGAQVLVIAGADDDEPFALAPARAFAATTGAELRVVDGVGHALAEEPGIQAAPQTAGAAQYDALAVDWFRRAFGQA